MTDFDDPFGEDTQEDCPFDDKVSQLTFDLDWKLDDNYVKRLDKLNKAKTRIESFEIGMKLPVITLLGKESAGKSTLINRIIGVSISNTNMGTCTIVPIYFTLSPIILEVGEPEYDFKIIYQGITYYKESIDKFQEAFEIKAKGMKNKTIEKEIQEVKVFGKGLPHIVLVDLPGSKGESSEEYKTTIEHLEKGGEYDLLVLVHALHAQNGLDEVAFGIREHFTKDLTSVIIKH